MRRVEFHPDADAEFLSAARHYEDLAENLGHDFVSSTQRAYERLIEFPQSGHLFSNRLRRVLVPGFPYGLIYRAENERIFIVAVAHLHRRPGYWRSRS